MNKIIDLSHDEVCLALIDYIKRDSNEKIIGTPILYVYAKDGKIESASIDVDIEKEND